MPEPEVDRRQRNEDDLPTKLEASFEALPDHVEHNLQRLGTAMIGVGFGVPLIMGALPNANLAGTYLVFCALGIIIGFLFVWPRGGITVFESLVKLAAKIVPAKSLKDWVKPVDRRSEGRDE